MAKRSSASEINGFISLKPDNVGSKKSVKKNESSSKKPAANKTTSSRDPSKDKKKDSQTLTPKPSPKPKSSNKPAVKSRVESTMTGKKEINTVRPSNTSRAKPSPSKGQVSNGAGMRASTTERTKQAEKPVSKTQKSTVQTKPLNTSRQSLKDLNRSEAGVRTPRKESPKRKDTPKKPSENLKPSVPDRPMMTPRQRTWVKEESEPTPGKPPGLHSQKPPVSTEPQREAINSYEEEKETANKTETSREMSKEEEEENYDYEDDFEEYESDFESDLSESGVSETNSELKDGFGSETDSSSKNEPMQNKGVEEERKLDSGNYDLTPKNVPSKSKAKQKEILEIKEAIQKENLALLSISENDIVDKNRVESTKGLSNRVYSRSIYNFSEALKDESKVNEEPKIKYKQRGKQLLSMIRLDVMNFSLLDMPALPYDVFMKFYGKSNTSQVSVQTNEDNLDEEVQTELPAVENKWTQYPVAYHSWSKTDPLSEYLEDREGVGGDVRKSVGSWFKHPKYNKDRYNSFINNAAEVMLILLEESMNPQDREKKMNLGFSDGYTSLKTDALHFLKGRKVTFLQFSPHHPFHLITVHRQEKLDAGESTDIYFSRCILCLWSILVPSQPQKILASPSHVTCLCFDLVHPSLVYAGLVDGSVCVWDLSERIILHQKSQQDGAHVLRSPTYCTADVMRDMRHLCSVVAISAFGSRKEIDTYTEGITPTQVISLDEDGLAIIWTVVRIIDSPKLLNLDLPIADLGLSPWGAVKLVYSSVLKPRRLFSDDCELENLQFTCMVRSPANDRSVLFGSNTGKVGRCMLSGFQSRPSLYLDESDEIHVTKCIEPCPNGLPLFLVGSGNGLVRLHSLDKPKPLLILGGDDEALERPIRTIAWSAQKPGLFFVADKKSCIHVWDLCKGDLFPQFSVPFQKHKLNCMTLASKNNPSYMALCLNSNVQVHTISKDFMATGSVEDESDTNKFKHYISLL